MGQLAVGFLCPPGTTGKLDEWVNQGHTSKPGGHTINEYIRSVMGAFPSIGKQVWLTFPAPAPIVGEFVIVYTESDDPVAARDRFLASSGGVETFCKNQIPGSGFGSNIPVNVFVIV